MAEEDAGIKTQLYKLTASVSFSYATTPWKIFLRKEVWPVAQGFPLQGCVPAAEGRGAVTPPNLQP